MAYLALVGGKALAVKPSQGQVALHDALGQEGEYRRRTQDTERSDYLAGRHTAGSPRQARSSGNRGTGRRA